ncbi:VirB2 family type IV secretion system major pilin TrwL [Bartonella sp. AU18XJBT]|uniref:VirB2 family type IV secretion system major pilin TrwL n=1 Tax=Bartonella sp. AU18XJBT TaxID=3019089 RepID=UPI00236131D1|nr:VirB2 family type IV secretion system major pilin TrwL [Bartonella sp. AU18XJBT]
MQMLNNPQSKSDNKITAIFTTIIVFFITYPISAQAQNLTKAKEALEKFKQQLDVIIPVASTVILLCLAIGYAGRYIEKDTFVRWAIGVVIAGSALQIANMLFKPN